jgi:hypothetical protein
MSDSKTVHVFQTGGAKKAFALSYEKSGSKLPKGREWRYWKSYDESNSKGRIGFDEDSQKALAEHGVWIPESLPEVEPEARPVKAKPRMPKKR